MATNLTMPRLSDTMTTGKILNWKVKPGDKIEPGSVLAEIESDKATMEFEAFEEGVILEIRVPAGESAPVGEVLAVLGEAGEVVAPVTAKQEEKKPEAKKETKAAKSEPKAKKEEPKPVPAPVPTPTPAVVPAPVQPVAEATSSRLVASPVAMRLAMEMGVDLRAVAGTGPDGRITRADVEAAVGKVPPPQRPVAPAPAPKLAVAPLAPAPMKTTAPAITHTGTEPMSQMRTAIARRMSDGWQAPMFTVTVEAKMDRIVDLRSQWKHLEGKSPSINDFIVAACARALQVYPQVNASFAGDAITYHEQQDIAIAVALDDGLITPVIRNAGKKSLKEIADTARELSEKAKAKKLQPEEFSGSTFTVSNLGMFDVVHFTAIVNPPEAAILAVGSVREIPCVVDGELSIERRMLMTISGDHRVIDGATGAKFLNEVKRLLETPLALL
ncbi:MAG: 2-oxo acid dehydrogenase subunit E2 [bacterium]|nr:2-oxo acid dehydrogenase subunit E2 [bacterium]